ncbi:MAG: hypothetical protein Q7R76_03940 [Candidatus Woesearchaeota archaeon]|nr:hypothetical protein [Candidatus Woesearchaeota archaeon]
MPVKVPEKSANEQEEDYDIVPHKRLIELEQKVDQIKQNPFASVPSGKELVESMRALNRNLTDLTGLFKTAADDIQTEQHDVTVVQQQMGPVAEKLDMLLEQNKKIARGIIAIADMLKDQGAKLEKLSMGNRSFPLPPGPMPPSDRMRPLMPADVPPADFPPPPGMGMGMESGFMSPPKVAMGRPMPPGSGTMFGFSPLERKK